jgi:hypothetical protein
MGSVDPRYVITGEQVDSSRDLTANRTIPGNLIMGQDPDGQAIPVRTDASGFSMSSSDFLEVAKGNVTGHAFRIIRGHKTDIDAADGFEDIWEGDGSMTHPTGAEAMTFVSTSDEDGAGTSTGALTVLVEYLDATYAYQTHTVTLNGTTGVTAGVPAMFRVLSMVVLTCGSAGWNVGDITATGATSGLLNEIDATDSISHSSHYTVPLGKTAHLIRVEFNASTPLRWGATAPWWSSWGRPAPARPAPGSTCLTARWMWRSRMT